MVDEKAFWKISGDLLRTNIMNAGSKYGCFGRLLIGFDQLSLYL
jgi:hypothetical protein